MAQVLSPLGAHGARFGESLRGKWIGAAGPRAPEREICLWEGLWEDLWDAFRGFQKCFRGFQKSSQRPSQRQISLSKAPNPVAPDRVAPWTFSKRIWRFYFAFAFVMEKANKLPRISFAFAFATIMLGLHKPQQQATCAKIFKIPQMFIRFAFVIQQRENPKLDGCFRGLPSRGCKS